MRKNRNDTGLEAIRIEGGLLSSSLLTLLRHYQLSGQTPEEYGIEKGLKLNDELGRYWRIAQARWQQFSDLKKRDDLDHDAVAKENWLIPLFTRVLGFQIEESRMIQIGERTFPITHTAFNGAVPFVLTASEHSLEKGAPRFGEEGRKRSPAGLLQEYINAEDSCLWAIVSNGLTLRLLRDNPAMTRPAYVEVDLERLFEEELYVDFTVLWLLLHASRLEPREKSPESCLLEQWRNQGQVDGERVLGELRHGVTNALRIMGTGFVAHPNNQELREAIKAEILTTDQFFQELLRLIYRFLFLLTTEDRDILLDPAADNVSKKLYREGYSISVLRERSRFRRHYDNYGDGWQQLCITFVGFATGQAKLAQPALGGLFSPDQCPQLEQAQLANRYLYDALFKLCYFESKGVLTRINYKDMDTEELGSVYESLLELIPQLNVNGQWRFGFLGDEADEENAAGHARKLTGSYYTPDSLVQELIKSALEPVVEDRLEKNKSQPREALLGISVCDPACGSGHFLLAAARRLAAELARIEAGTDQPTEANYRHALREVVSHCIYGVDINPLAVELCRTALWLEAIEPGKPLGFLDAHIRVGNSLIGILDPELLRNGIPDKAFQPLTGDDKGTAANLKSRNRIDVRQRQLFAEHETDLDACAIDLAAMPEESLEQVELKRDAWLTMIHNTACLKEKLRADLFTAAFFGSKNPENSQNVPTNVELSAPDRGESLLVPMKKYIQELAERFRFFHWHLAFPEIFELGGFDVVLGNPPWGRIKVSENDFFESRYPIISNEKKKSNRKSLIENLNHPNAHDWEKKLYMDFLAAKHEAEAIALFSRCSGRYPLTAYGDLNLYPLFSELSLYLINLQGRCGIVVKTGIATDDGNKAFFEYIVRKEMLCRLVSFVEIRKIFKGAKSPDPFCLIVLSAKPETAELMFGLYNVSQASDYRRAFKMTYQDFVTVNPNTLTCPTFQSEADASLVKKIYSSAGVFINETNSQNPWNACLHRMFDMSNDSHLFKTGNDFISDGLRIEKPVFSDTENNKWLPIIEAKLIHQFDHRWASFDIGSERARDTTLQEKRSRDFTSLPRYWVKSEEIENWKKVNEYDKPYVVCWRNNARVVLQRTLISSIIPLYGIGNSLSFITFPKETSPQLLITLAANLNSIILDYVVRLKLAGPNLNFFFVKQFPVIPPNHYSEVDIAYIMPRALELIYTNHELEPFAKDLGYEGDPFPFSPERRLQLRCELDAYYARLYGLTRDELRYILDPTNVMGEDYPTETFRVLKNKEMNEFGEYRTQRLVLEAWDELSATETIKKAAPVAEFSLYPDTDADRAICAVALALVQQTGGMGSMDHLDALILAARPQLSRVFLSKSEHHFLDAALASSPKALWSDNRLNIRWKECRDHLEARKAILVRHGVKDQPIETGSEFSTVQANFPGHVDEIAVVALNALAKVKELRKSRDAATLEQEKILNVFDEQHRAYQLAV